jgi:glycosyltransferase involved in cell wall biosynthesis
VKVLFVRSLTKMSGGQIKVRDYFEHCLRHPALDPYVYFTPRSDPGVGGLWEGLAADRRVASLDPAAYDLLFVAGKDWALLPDDPGSTRVVNLIQHTRHGDLADARYSYLSRPALRICVSPAVRDAVAPHVRGDVAVIPNGIPLDLFRPRAGEKKEGSILVWAGKDPRLGERLGRTLREMGIHARVLHRSLSRANFAETLRSAGVFVGLPNEREGFFLPALEAMAAGCAVICAPAGGNESFCIDGETCLMARHGDLDDHLAAVERLLGDRALAGALRTRGRVVAQEHSLGRERSAFYELIERTYSELRMLPAVAGAER